MRKYCIAMWWCVMVVLECVVWLAGVTCAGLPPVHLTGWLGCWWRTCLPRSLPALPACQHTCQAAHCRPPPHHTCAHNQQPPADLPAAPRKPIRVSCFSGVTSARGGLRGGGRAEQAGSAGRLLQVTPGNGGAALPPARPHTSPPP